MTSINSSSPLLTETSLFKQVKGSLEKYYPHLANDEHTVWRDIVNETSFITMPAGTMLMNPNTPCLNFLLLTDGRVRVYQQTPNDKEVTLYRTHGGELCVLSINGLIKDKNFGAFAQSESMISGISFSREQFLYAMANYQPFLEFVLLSITDRFNDVLKLMEEIAFDSLDTRLICLLARITREKNSDTLQITHQDIARELGSSREVISRLLKGMEKRGCIELGRGSIHVLI